MNRLKRLFETVPRLMLLDQLDENGEPACAVICAGQQPVIYRSLTRALDVLRAEGAEMPGQVSL